MLGALILIFIVIAAGAFVYNYVMVSGKNINGGASASISSVALTALPGGGGLLSVSIANTGAVPIFPAVSLYSGGASVFSTGAAGTSSSWSSVFGGAAWHGQGATQYTWASPGIQFTNAQGVATPAPFQQMVYVPDSTASSLGVASNAQNVMFLSGGSNLYSWFEGNNGTGYIWWVKLPNGIPASSSIQIQMDVMPGANDYATYYPYVGEAPQLSSTYGQYDNGANVFNNYWNFAGTTLPSSLTEESGGGSISVNNGITLSVSSSTNGGDVLVRSTNAIPYPQITDALIQTSVSSTYPTTVIGEATSSTEYGQSGWLENGYSWDYYQNYWRLESITPSARIGIIGINSNTIAGDVYSIVWVAVGNEKTYINYVNQVDGTDTTVSSIGNYYVWLGIDGNTGSTYSAQWLCTRAYPPNGVMPGETILSSIPSGIYYVAADWVNMGGPGMSAITYSGAQAASSGWQTIGSSSFTESYSTIQANPPDPPGTVGPSGLLPTAMYDYGTPNSYQGNTYLGIVCAPFPAPFGVLNQFGGGLGYAASTYMVFTSSVTFNIETDDAMEVFYQPASVSPGQALSLSFTIPSGIALGGTYSVVLTASSVQGSLGLSQQVVAS